MSGSRGKKDAAYSALRSLLEEPGSVLEILHDLSEDTATVPLSGLKRLIVGTRRYDDRGVAIVFGSMLEQNLEIAISSHFVIAADESRRMFSYTEDGPLSNFAAKIAMGHALGVYDQRMRSDLVWIKHIRNAFAHARIEVDFNTEAVSLACERLIFPAKQTDPNKGIAKTPRQRFVACVGFISIYLRAGPPGPRKFEGSAAYAGMYGAPRSSPETP